MIKGPSTYAEWNAALDRFAANDDTVLPEMEAGSFVMDAGVAQRFYNNVEKAYRLRKEAWLQRFNQSLKTASIRSVNEFGVVLRDAKANLLPLQQFIQAKGLPTELRDVLDKDLKAFTGEVKKNLITNLAANAPNREAILLQLNSFEMYTTPAATPAAPNNQTDTKPGPGRRIIF